MKLSYKFCLGLLVWVILGFLIAEVALAIGFFTIMIFIHVPWWKILLLTVLGMIAVALHLVGEMSKENKTNEKLG
jgi:ABC-type multidrug transport system permease subunit